MLMEEIDIYLGRNWRDSPRPVILSTLQQIGERANVGRYGAFEFSESDRSHTSDYTAVASDEQVAELLEEAINSNSHFCAKRRAKL